MAASGILHRPARATAALVVVVAVLALVGPLAACSGDDTASGGGGGQTVEIVVPSGTQALLDAGQSVDVMPARLVLQVGDTLVIENRDSVTQAVGPYTVQAGKTVRLTYGTAGRFEGYCPLSEGERYEIVVED